MIDPAATAVVLASCAGAGALFARCTEGLRPRGRSGTGVDSADGTALTTAPPDPPAVIEPDVPAGAVIVRLLGAVAVEVDGEPISSPSVVELVAYLVTHRNGVSDQRLKTALWPERVPQGATFNNLVSLARSQLGRAGDGSLHLPHAEGRRYRVGPGVVSDWEQLAAATKAVARSASRAAVDELERVLLIPDGIPFEALRGFQWAHEEGLIAAAATDVERSVDLLARVLRGIGEEERAERALLATRRVVHHDG